MSQPTSVPRFLLRATAARVPSLVRTTASILCVTVLCYVASEYMALYTKKTSWYSLEQLIPPLVSDNGWSGMGSRGYSMLWWWTMNHSSLQPVQRYRSEFPPEPGSWRGWPVVGKYASKNRGTGQETIRVKRGTLQASVMSAGHHGTTTSADLANEEEKSWRRQGLTNVPYPLAAGKTTTEERRSDKTEPRCMNLVCCEAFVEDVPCGRVRGRKRRGEERRGGKQDAVCTAELCPSRKIYAPSQRPSDTASLVPPQAHAHVHGDIYHQG